MQRHLRRRRRSTTARAIYAAADGHLGGGGICGRQLLSGDRDMNSEGTDSDPENSGTGERCGRQDKCEVAMRRQLSCDLSTLTNDWVVRLVTVRLLLFRSGRPLGKKGNLSRPPKRG